MASSTDVNVPRLIKPEFPDCCVVCEEKPDSTAKIIQNSVNPLAAFLMPIMLVFGWSRVEFPICYGCKSRFYFQRWGRSAICWAIMIIAVPLVMPYFAQWDRMTRRLAVGGIVILIMIPWIMFEIFFPRSFDTTAGSSKVSYEFRSRALGMKFFLRNIDKHPNAKITIELGDD